MKPLKNIPASVLARLKNIARKQGRDFNFLVNLYCRERFLYLLGVSKYKNNLLLKGGLLLLNVVDSLVRPTKDIDVLGVDISNDISSLKAIISEICSVDAEDGVTFDLQDLTGEEITKAGGYPGIRLKFKAFIGKSWFPMQIDFGFGDVVVPEPVEFEYPTLLDFPPPRIKAYSFESVIAEKFEAMCSLGLGNSRMQDFYDLYVLALAYNFQIDILREAIEQTFTVRDTNLDLHEMVFGGPLAKDHVMQARWTTYLDRPGMNPINRNFPEVIEFLAKFLQPVIQSISEQSVSSMIWDHGSSVWKDGEY